MKKRKIWKSFWNKYQNAFERFREHGYKHAEQYNDVGDVIGAEKDGTKIGRHLIIKRT